MTEQLDAVEWTEKLILEKPIEPMSTYQMELAIPNGVAQFWERKSIVCVTCDPWPDLLVASCGFNNPKKLPGNQSVFVYLANVGSQPIETNYALVLKLCISKCEAVETPLGKATVNPDFEVVPSRAITDILIRLSNIQELLQGTDDDEIESDFRGDLIRIAEGIADAHENISAQLGNLDTHMIRATKNLARVADAIERLSNISEARESHNRAFIEQLKRIAKTQWGVEIDNAN